MGESAARASSLDAFDARRSQALREELPGCCCGWGTGPGCPGCATGRKGGEPFRAKRMFRLLATVEALANDLAKICFEDKGVQKLILHVEKPGAVRFAKSVGVEIERFPVRVRDGAYEVVHHREVLGCSHWIRYSNRTHG